MTSTCQIAVIDAGISGLTTLTMLRDYGDYRIDAVCVEASERIGGNWAFDNPDGGSSAYHSLHIDTSGHQLSVRDFPIPEEFPNFPLHNQTKRYPDDYPEAFGLLPAIGFETRVEHAERLPDGGREPTTSCTGSAVQAPVGGADGDGGGDGGGGGGTLDFDGLVVDNGHHRDPRLPDFPDEFTGEMIHSHAYVDPWDPLHLMDKEILAFGGFALSTPTLFPFVEAQARLVAAWAAGLYRTPPLAETERVIVEDQKKYIGHMIDTPRHQQQVDYFLYERDRRTREIPHGLERGAALRARVTV